MAVTDTTPHPEKVDDLKVEDSSDISETQDAFSSKEERKLRHRVDWRLIPALGLMYGISLMDRKNVSNANIAGMSDDLGLEIGYRYSLITLTFFITYVVCQPPSK